MIDTARIMLIDDEPDNLEPLRVLLDSYDYSIDIYSDARKALEYLKKHENDLPDIIVSDIVMPSMNGYQFAEAFRGDHRLSHIPLIFISARADLPEKIRVRTVTPHFFAKSGEPRELLAMIQSVISEQRFKSGVNPLTGLPGSGIIERRFNDIVKKQLQYSVYLIDFDNFKAFNDAYGVYAGDRTLREMAHALDKAFIEMAEGSYILGHLSGDHFVAVLWNDTAPEAVCRRIFDVTAKMRERIYALKDLEQGYFELKTRKGGVQHCDLLSVSIGVLWSAVKALANWSEASNYLQEVIGKAKTQKGNSFCIDNRRKK